jgi:hypothetical protein
MFDCGAVLGAISPTVVRCREGDGLDVANAVALYINYTTRVFIYLYLFMKSRIQYPGTVLGMENSFFICSS